MVKITTRWSSRLVLGLGLTLLPCVAWAESEPRPLNEPTRTSEPAPWIRRKVWMPHRSRRRWPVRRPSPRPSCRSVQLPKPPRKNRRRPIQSSIKPWPPK